MKIKKFQIVKKLHEDVIGNLYVANTVDLGNTVFIKILHEDYAEDEKVVQTFHECAENYRDLEKEFHLGAFDHGQDGPHHYIVYRYLLFEPLDTVLERRQLLSTVEAHSLIESIAATLRTAHIDEIVHGTLSPQSIFVDENLQNVKLCNFGFAQLIRALRDGRQARLREFLPYYAPELIRTNQTLDRTYDVYSLGVLFYRMLVGELPESDQDRTHRNSSPLSIVPPSLHRLETPDLLDRIILRALEQEPEKRYHTLSDFLNDLSKSKASVTASAVSISAQAEESSPGILISEESNKAGVDRSSDSGIPATSPRQTSNNQFSKQEPAEAAAFGEQNQSNESSPVPEETRPHPEQIIEAASGAAPQTPIEKPVQGEPEIQRSQEQSNESLKFGHGQEKPIQEETDVQESGNQNIAKTEPNLSDSAATAKKTTSTDETSSREQQSPRATNRERGKANHSQEPHTPPPSPSNGDDAIQEIDEFLEDSFTETEEFATTQIVDAMGGRFRMRSIGSTIRVALLVILPLGAIYFLLARTSDFTLFGGLFGSKESPFSQKEVSTQRSEPEKHSTKNKTNAKEYPQTPTGNVKANNRGGKSKDNPNRVSRAADSTSSASKPALNRTPVQASNATLKLAVYSGRSPLVAEIYLDGAFYARTNAQGTVSLQNLKIGKRYVVKIKKTGFQVWAKEVRFTRPGVQNVRVNLRQLPTSLNNRSPGNSQRRPSNRQASTTNGTDTTTKPKGQASNFGVVKVRLSNPEPISEARIYVNGDLWQGKQHFAPAELQLPGGSYAVKIKKDGYRSEPPSYSINITNGTSKTIYFYLTPK